MTLLGLLASVYLMTATPQTRQPVSGEIPTQAQVIATLKSLNQQASLPACQDAYSYRTVSPSNSNMPTFLYQEARAIYPAAPKVEIHILPNVLFAGKSLPQKLYYFKVNNHSSTFVHFYMPSDKLAGQLYKVYGCRIK